MIIMNNVGAKPVLPLRRNRGLSELLGQFFIMNGGLDITSHFNEV